MGSNNDKLYEENKVEIHLCQTQNSILINFLKDSLFPNENLELKKEIKIKDNKEYIYFKGKNYGLINENIINTIFNKISYNKNTKNIVICFLNNNDYFELLKNKFLGIIEENRPLVIFVKINEFSQNIREVKKLSQINIIKYFNNSENDISKANTQKTYNILYSKLLQIDAYLNERGTIFRDYLFGLMNNIQGEINENIQIDDINPGNRSTLNIFLFGNPRTGKSRFINLSMNELISREINSTENITKKFTEYELPIRQNNNGELGQIVLYDSPGLTEDINVINGLKVLIKNKLSYFSIRKETVPILLFFIKNGDGISNTIFNFIKDLNNKNFNIFFIITHAKKDSDKARECRNNLIHRLRRDRILTNKNLEMLNNNGENIINVNLKSDNETGESYGLSRIYQKIFNLFPEDFVGEVDEANNINDLNGLLGYITYKNYFFLNNCQTRDDFLSRVNAKIDDKIHISASLAVIPGLIPIPFADIPFIIALEVGLIKYISRMYNIDETQVNRNRLLILGPLDNLSVILLNGLTQILKISQLFDIIPIVGSIVSPMVNAGTIIIFGKSIKKHFKNLCNIEKIIKDILKDYRGIFFQLRDDLGKRENFNI